ncbi:MAG TPA: SDR family oxidoreductase [Bacteroidales bacterium]|nr:SDR family oxidoreductase [Bacteroidales bacterium]
MKIAVFGSTGPSGQLIVKYALSKGFEVMAYARNPSKISFQDKNLTVIEGTLGDITAIERTVSEAQAVISILGATTNVKTTELSDGTQNIIDAMKKYNVRRLIAMGTASVDDANDRHSFKFRLLVKIVKSLIPGAYNEIRRIGNLVKQSGLDWTLVRLAVLANGPAKGIKHVGYYGKDNIILMVTRADLARFFVDQVESREYIQKAPAISN